MAIYAMADLHLSLGKPEKSMEVFGRAWENYIPRIEENWRKTVKETDTVLISGDISWETYLSDAAEDFKFINSLPGRKILSRGNHDYWWTSFKKMDDFLAANGLGNISFCRTNIIEAEDAIISGTRGWLLPNDREAKEEDRKFFARETERLNVAMVCADKAVNVGSSTCYIFMRETDALRHSSRASGKHHIGHTCAGHTWQVHSLV